MPPHPASQPSIVQAPEVVPEQRLRAKRIGGPFASETYPAARAVTAHSLHRAMELCGVSERQLAEAGRVSRSLVHQWLDPEGHNFMRLDVALCIASGGGSRVRDVVMLVLEDALACVKNAQKVT